ncbi:MAG: polyphosphate polymerase domain-containing protein [Anaerolineae bacterium]|nr:polyphosphate polymerase domain-containing protein [Anaerolineae bacterium]
MQAEAPYAIQVEAPMAAAPNQRIAARPAARREAELRPLLAHYAPISLNQMDGVALMRRYDTKYLLSAAQLRAVLAALAADYCLLHVGGVRLNRYRTLYFDTPDRTLYLSHHRGCSQRFKVRSRAYLDSGASFLEVKQRTGPGRTVKERIPTEEWLAQLTPEAEAFVDGLAPLSAGALQPMLTNSFSRLTLVSVSRPERATFDLDVCFYAGRRGCTLGQAVIAEVKQERPDRNSGLVAELRALDLHPTRFSKYCIGTALLWPEIKHNRFKPVLRRVNAVMRGGRHG